MSTNFIPTYSAALFCLHAFSIHDRTSFSKGISKVKPFKTTENYPRTRNSSDAPEILRRSLKTYAEGVNLTNGE